MLALFLFVQTIFGSDPVPSATPALMPALTAQTPTSGPDMIAKYEVADVNRLPITPMIDGRFDEEEWDLLHASADAPTYHQWEPGHLYLGASVPSGKDMVFSLDLRGDGWLVGNDNLELRASWADGAPVVSARILDATNRNAPIWIYAPMTESLIKSAGVLGEGRWTLELNLQTVDLPNFVLGRTLGVRSDLVDKGAPSSEPYSPRACSLITLRYERSRGLPAGMSWAPEYKVRTVTPGDTIKIRLTFENNGTGEFRRVEMRSEGFAKDATKLVAEPFPTFDKKKRSFVDFETGVAGDAKLGFRILRARLTGPNGEDTVIQSSYQIAETLAFDVNMPLDLIQTADSRVIKGSVTLRSNTPNRVNGTLKIKVPETWSVAKGQDRKFVVYHSRGLQKLAFELIAPQREQGLIPIQFSAQIGSRTVEYTHYLPIR